LGTEVIARLREEMGLLIPALLISGHSDVAALGRMRLPRCEVLIKPVLARELKDASMRLLAIHPGSQVGEPGTLPLAGAGVDRHSRQCG